MAKKRERVVITPQVLNWVKYYARLGNGAKAYRMAYNARGMNPRSVEKEATRLINDPLVSPLIEKEREKRARRFDKQRDVIEDWLFKMFNSDISEMFYEDPVTGKEVLCAPAQLPAELRACIKKMRNNKGVVDYDFITKVEIASLLGKWNGWEKSNVNVNHNFNEFGEIVLGDELSEA